VNRLEPTKRDRIISSTLWSVVSLPFLFAGVVFARDLGIRSVQAWLPLVLFALCLAVAFLVPTRWRIVLSDWLPPGF
jgi:hypothetical protein